KASRFHIGDLAWGRFQHTGCEAEWPTAIWEFEGSVVAWGWVRLPGDLELMVHPRHRQPADEVLDWFEGVADGRTLSVTVLEAETHLVDALRRRRYAASKDGPFDLYESRRLEDIPAAQLPSGFNARNMRNTCDVARRAEVHRAAWSATLMPNPAPSRVTAEAYWNVMAAWPYLPELDWVVEAPDGRFASCCIAWLDEKNCVGELEPVGTHPDFRRLGLARAVCLSALHALREKGARLVVVYPRGDDAYPVPRMIYGELGFKQYGRTRIYRLNR
ncbi:MAG TPA: GNAT family N-acetyltransferase, partial [Patescibacteria group bacterium]|nr:GNAT family N-acetyltransferase [Patescibacteria group bacterium]